MIIIVMIIILITIIIIIVIIIILIINTTPHCLYRDSLTLKRKRDVSGYLPIWF